MTRELNVGFRPLPQTTRGPGPGETLAGALRDQVALDLGEQREERGHDLGLDVALAVDADVLLERHEGDPRLGEGVEDGHDLTQRPAEAQRRNSPMMGGASDGVLGRAMLGW